MDDWQQRLDRINERGKHLLETGIWSDCQFLVGNGQHKKASRNTFLIISLLVLRQNTISSYTIYTVTTL